MDCPFSKVIPSLLIVCDSENALNLMLEALSHFNCALETISFYKYWFANAQSGVILWRMLRKCCKNRCGVITFSPRRGRTFRAKLRSLCNWTCGVSLKTFRRWNNKAQSPLLTIVNLSINFTSNFLVCKDWQYITILLMRDFLILLTS